MTQVLINSVDLTNLIIERSLIVDTSVTNQVSTSSFSVRKYGTRTFVPDVDDTIEIYDDSDLIFNGIIMNVSESIEGPEGLLYDVQCASSSWKLDRLLVARAYENKTVQTIIQEMVAEFASDFTTVNVEGDFLVDRFLFNNITVSDAISRLAKLLSYEWWVDVNDDIHFAPRLAEDAPYDLTDSNGNYAYRTMIRNLDGSQIVNKVIVFGGEYDGDTFTDEITVEGSVTQSFNLPYKFSNFTVDLDTGGGFVSQTVGVDPIDEFPDFDVLYNFQGQSFKFASALAAGDIIRFSGNPKYPVRGLGGSAASIAQYGLREKIIRDKSIEDNDTARRRAIAELQTYAQEIQDVTFFTYTSGLRAGMRINLTSAERDCNVDFVIKKLTYETIDPETFGYRVECITTEKYDLIDLLRSVTETDEIGTGDNIVELFETTGDTLEIVETITNVQPEADNAIMEVTEDIQDDPLGPGIIPTWVLAYYVPTSIIDTKRMGRLNNSLTVY